MATGTCKPRQKRRAPHLELIGLRVNAGWSREILAYRCGLSRETIRLAEDGFVPSPRTQFAIAGAFELRPLDLWPIDLQRGVA
jgi:DNA-binding XRE family transcriptional regulator